MRSRLIVVSGVLIAAWIAACGSDGSSVAPGDSGDAGNVGTTTPTSDAAGDGSLATDAPTEGSVGPAACDTASATTCAPRKCDANLGCVACTADPDRTGADKFCIRGSCEACRTNTDCAVAAPACSLVDHRCHLSCVGDAAVTCGGTTPTCDTTTGACAADFVCVECATTADCPRRPLRAVHQRRRLQRRRRHADL